MSRVGILSIRRISKPKHFLFTVPQALVFFRGCIYGWIDPKREPPDDFDALRGTARQGESYDVQELKANCSIEIPQISKVESAIATTRNTGADVVVFGQR